MKEISLKVDTLISGYFQSASLKFVLNILNNITDFGMLRENYCSKTELIVPDKYARKINLFNRLNTVKLNPVKFRKKTSNSLFMFVQATHLGISVYFYFSSVL